MKSESELHVCLPPTIEFLPLESQFSSAALHQVIWRSFFVRLQVRGEGGSVVGLTSTSRVLVWVSVGSTSGPRPLRCCARPRRRPSLWCFLSANAHVSIRSVTLRLCHLLPPNSLFSVPSAALSFLLLFTPQHPPLFSPTRLPPPLTSSQPAILHAEDELRWAQRERFLRVSSEILPDLLVCWNQVIVSIPLRGG